MRNRSKPDRARSSRTGRPTPRSSVEVPMMTPPFPWTDRDFGFHALHALRRPGTARSEAPRQRDGGRTLDVRTHTEDSTALERAKAMRGSRDTSLRDQVAHRLVAEAGEDAHAVRVSVSEGIVTLDGPVPQRYTKEMVEAIVEAVPGVQGVDNRLCVDWIDGTPSVDRIDEAPAPPRKEYLSSTRGSPTSPGKRT